MPGGRNSPARATRDSYPVPVARAFHMSPRYPFYALPIVNKRRVDKLSAPICSALRFCPSFFAQFAIIGTTMASLLGGPSTVHRIKTPCRVRAISVLLLCFRKGRGSRRFSSGGRVICKISRDEVPLSSTFHSNTTVASFS